MELGTTIFIILGFGYLLWMGGTLAFLSVRGIIRGYRKGMVKEFVGEIWKLTDHLVEFAIGGLIVIQIVIFINAFLGKS